MTTARNRTHTDRHARRGTRLAGLVTAALLATTSSSLIAPAQAADSTGRASTHHRNDAETRNDGKGHRPPPARPRREVKRAISRSARRHGVDPQLALAIAWQESGWQMDVLSSAGAVGAMQVLPSTARWMEQYAGRDLHLRRLRDNAAAGTLLLQVLDANTERTHYVIAAYYQGLGAVRRYGLYRETKQYVANVWAIKRRLEDGRAPRSGTAVRDTPEERGTAPSAD